MWFQVLVIMSVVGTVFVSWWETSCRSAIMSVFRSTLELTRADWLIALLPLISLAMSWTQRRARDPTPRTTARSWDSSMALDKSNDRPFPLSSRDPHRFSRPGTWVRESYEWLLVFLRFRSIFWCFHVSERLVVVCGHSSCKGFDLVESGHFGEKGSSPTLNTLILSFLRPSVSPLAHLDTSKCWPSTCAMKN